MPPSVETILKNNLIAYLSDPSVEVETVCITKETVEVPDPATGRIELEYNGFKRLDILVKVGQ